MSKEFICKTCGYSPEELCKQIADLEEKLADSDRELKLAQKLHTELFLSYEKIKDNRDQLKQQLAEKNRFLRLVDKDYEKLEKQFEELNSNVSKLQSDIEFVAKQLEQIFLDFNKKVDDEFGNIDIKYIMLDVEEVNFYLKDKIKSIKEGNDYVG